MQALSFRGIWEAVNAKITGRKFFQNVGVLTASNLAGAVFSVFQGIVVARWLGPELYGVTALVMSYPGVVFAFFDARSSEASVKYLGEFHARGDRDQLLAMCKLGYAVDFVVAALAFAAVLVTANWSASRIAHRPEAAGLVILYSAAFIPRSLIGTSSAVFATLNQFSLIAWTKGATDLFRVLLILGLVLSGHGVEGVVWGGAIGMVVTGLLYGVIADSLIRRTWGASWLSGTLRVLKGRSREIVWFLVNNNIYALSGMISKQLDVVLLGYYRTPTEVGYYRLAKSVSGVVGYVGGPLQSVSYPELVRLWSLGNGSAFRRKVGRLAWQVGLPIGLLALSGVMLVQPALMLVVGSAYLPAVLATQLFLTKASWESVFFWLRPSYMAVNRIGSFVVISGAFTGVLLLGWLAIVSTSGLIGVIVVALIITILHDLCLTSLLYWRSLRTC